MIKKPPELSIKILELDNKYNYTLCTEYDVTLTDYRYVKGGNSEDLLANVTYVEPVANSYCITIK